MAELGIVDIREIVRIIKSIHNYDFSNFALTSFKYSLEKIIDRYGLVNVENLMKRLYDEVDFFDTFLNDIFVPSTEMFRDPSLWRWLREDYFPNIPARHFDNFKIWIPRNVSGAELYTICILLKELGINDKVKIIATVFSDESLAIIKSGKYPLKKLEVSIENYKRFHGTSSFDSYYRIENNESIRDNSLISSVEFIKDDINFSNAPKNVKFILFRNSLIYDNLSRQNMVLEKMHEVLSATGCLIIGAKENIQSYGGMFDIINENENIYKKKI